MNSKMHEVNAHAGVWASNFFLFWAELFLAVRFILHFFAVSPSGGFGGWVFNSTDALMQPFRGVFANGSGALAGHPHFVDLQTLFVMAAYAVFVGLLWSVMSWCRRTVAVNNKKVK